LKGKFNKDLKEKISKLSRDEIIRYLKEGKINVNGIDILEGWLTISK